MLNMKKNSKGNFSEKLAIFKNVFIYNIEVLYSTSKCNVKFEKKNKKGNF